MWKTGRRDVVTGCWRNRADCRISRHIPSDLSIMAPLGMGIICQGSNRGRERESYRKEWMALHLEDRINE